MRTIHNLLQSSLKVNIKLEALVALEDSSDEYIRLQKQQLADGMRSDHEQIFNVKTGSEYYSKSYAKYKGKDEPIDLRDTGSFYNGIHTKIESEGLLVDSDDPKSAMLQKTYGKKILGLDTERKIQFNPIAGQMLVDNVEKQLNER